MTRRTIPFLFRVALGAALFSSSFAATCLPHAHTPPAAVAPPRPSGTLEDGEHSIEGFALGGDVGELGVFGDYVGSVAGGGLRYAHRFTGLDLEIDTDLAYAAISRDAGTSVNDATFAAGHWGLRWAPNPHFAMGGGGGGGITEVGGTVSGDAFVTGAYRNRFVVPYASLDVSVSRAVNPQPFTVTTDLFEGESQEVTLALRPSRMARATVGVEVPLGGWRDGHAEAHVGCAAFFGSIRSDGIGDGVGGGTCTVRGVFGGRREAAAPPTNSAPEREPVAPTPVPAAPAAEPATPIVLVPEPASSSAPAAPAQPAPEVIIVIPAAD